MGRKRSPEALRSLEVVGVICPFSAPFPACLRLRRPSHALRTRPAFRRCCPPQLQHLGPGRPDEGLPAGEALGQGHVHFWLASSLDPRASCTAGPPGTGQRLWRLGPALIPAGNAGGKARERGRCPSSRAGVLLRAPQLAPRSPRGPAFRRVQAKECRQGQEARTLGPKVICFYATFHSCLTHVIPPVASVQMIVCLRR